MPKLPERRRRPEVKSKRRLRKQRPDRNQSLTRFGRVCLLAMLEFVGLAITAIFVMIVWLGYSAARFSGTHLFTDLLPFIAAALGLVLLSALFLTGWWKFRKLLGSRAEPLPSILSIGLAGLVGWSATHGEFAQAFTHFKTLVGGKQEVRRITLAHQVYAAYRRYDDRQLQRLINRGQSYRTAIEAAAAAFGIDTNLLQGVAAAESSFKPRTSRDGGQGLFQITRVPKAAMKAALRRLDLAKPQLQRSRDNAFIAAATLKYYLKAMDGDPVLGLLAYNIGPANGGLRYIMQHYGATDFVTVQPYLQQWPRDYPIRVLSYALAFRIWQREGKLLPYELAGNAARIQNIGIPGLEWNFEVNRINPLSFFSSL